MPIIKAKFQALGLSERATNCPFKQFFIAHDLKFSRILIHQLLLRKVKVKERNEMHFLVGEKNCQFKQFFIAPNLKFSRILIH